MRWPLARRLLALPLTVLVVTVLAFAALSASGSADPELAHLPRFFNPRVLDVRARADAAIDALAVAPDPRASEVLVYLGGAALPIVLPRLEGLEPGPRARVALALAPLALRMGLPAAHQDPARAAAAWQLWWEEHVADWKPSALRRVVHRYVTHPSPARLSDVRTLDTAALADILAELGHAPSRDVEDGLLAAAEHALGLRLSGDVDERVARLQALFRAHGSDFVALDGAARPVAALLETRYGKWATRALVGDLGRARDGRSVLSVVVSASRVTLPLVAIGSVAGIVLAVALAVALAVRPRAAIPTTSIVLALGAASPLVALAALGTPFFRGAIAIAIVVVAAALPVVLTRLLDALSTPVATTARAFGASPARVATIALRGGPIACALASLAAALPASFTTAFVVEKLFDLRGLGAVAADAVGRRDVTVLMAIAVLASLSGVASLLVADLAQLAADRRIEEAP